MKGKLGKIFKALRNIIVVFSNQSSKEIMMKLSNIDNEIRNMSNKFSDFEKIKNNIQILLRDSRIDNKGDSEINKLLNFHEIDIVSFNELPFCLNTNDLVYSLFYANDLYFSSLKDDINVLKKIINFYRSNDLNFTFIDIGAQYGFVGLSIAEYFKKQGIDQNTILFEPGISQIPLEYNIVTNGLKKKVRLEKKAVSEDSGTAKIYIKNGNSEDNHISARIDDEYNYYYLCDKISLDHYFKQNNILENPILKIDTQGEDYNVIKGMKSVIRDKICSLLIEFTPFLYGDLESKNFLKFLSEDFYLFDMSIEYPENIELLNKWKGIELTSDLFDDFITDVNKYKYSYTDILAISKKLNNFEFLKKDLFL